MVNEPKERLLTFLDKGIIVNLYIFAFSCSISKALTSTSGGFICLFWLMKLIVTKNYKFQISSIGLPFIIFTAGILISGIDAWNSETADTFGKFLLLALFYFAVINTKIELKTIKSLSIVTLLSMLISSFYGLYQYYYLHLPRTVAFCGPLAFGNLLGIVMLFTITFMLWSDTKKNNKIILLFTTLLFGLNLLCTLARGAWLGFLGGLFILFWLKNKKLLIFLATFCIILLLGLPPVYVDRFYSSFNTNDNLTRLVLWKAAIQLFLDHPINGVGIGNYSNMFQTKYTQGKDLTTTVHAHNNFLHYMAEMGIIGLLSFTWLMLAVLRLLYQNYKQNPDPNWRLFFLASFCGIIVFNIQGLTENTFADAETIRFFWFLLGLNVSISNHFKANSKQIPTNLHKAEISLNN